VIAALRTLVHDGWVLGIAAAGALAYATVTLIENAIGVVMSIVDGYPAPKDSGTIEDELDAFSASFYPWSLEINGNLVMFEPLVRSLALFAIVLPLAAAVLHVTRTPENDAT
jgi:hypothetical protein